jgi:hypothetical protein
VILSVLLLVLLSVFLLVLLSVLLLALPSEPTWEQLSALLALTWAHS